LRPETLPLLNCLEAVAAKAKGKASSDDSQLLAILNTWHCEPEVLPASVDFAVECLAVAHALPVAARQLGEQRWWQLLDELLQLAASAADWPIDAEMPPAQAFAQQLLVAELPLTLTYLFPEIKPCYKLRQTGCDALSEGLQEAMHLCLGKGVHVEDMKSVQRDLDDAVQCINERWPRRCLGGRTAAIVDDIARRGYAAVRRSPFYRACERAVEWAVNELENARERLAEREAVYATMERFGLIRRTRGGELIRAAIAERIT